MEKYQATTKNMKNNLDVANVGGFGVKTAKKEAKNLGQNDSGRILQNCFLTPLFCPSETGLRDLHREDAQNGHKRSNVDWLENKRYNNRKNSKYLVIENMAFRLGRSVFKRPNQLVEEQYGIKISCFISTLTIQCFCLRTLDWYLVILFAFAIVLSFRRPRCRNEE